MKLDFLADGSTDGPLLRLHHFTPKEAEQLLDSISTLASGRENRIDVHQLPYVIPVDDSRLTLVVRQWDQAVVRVAQSVFECGFTATTWENVGGLIEPFTRDESDGGFQWLAESPGEAAVLLSVSGRW
jgi:hypothetical protein